MGEDFQSRADERFQEALEDSGARDPRDYYRERLRELRTEDADAYETAVRHYSEELVPSVAKGEAEPLAAWREFGLMIARLTAEGRTVEVDPTGRSRPFDPATPPDRMVLHLPDEKRRKALLVSLPADPSPAQKATLDLLVEGRQSLD